MITKVHELFAYFHEKCETKQARKFCRELRDILDEGAIRGSALLKHEAVRLPDHMQAVFMKELEQAPPLVLGEALMKKDENMKKAAQTELKERLDRLKEQCKLPEEKSEFGELPEEKTEFGECKLPEEHAPGPMDKIYTLLGYNEEPVIYEELRDVMAVLGLHWYDRIAQLMQTPEHLSNGLLVTIYEGYAANAKRELKRLHRCSK